MKDNINYSNIYNRKIIIELRYKVFPGFFDKKGKIIESILNSNIIPDAQWSLGDTFIKVSDIENSEQERIGITVSANRLSFISSKIETVSLYLSQFEKFFNQLTNLNEKIEVVRIGCRIQGTYKVKSTTFDGVLQNFIKNFPNHILFDGFNINDLHLRINHAQGMYIIGPVNIEDTFTNENFKYEGTKKNIGIAIDTDNFISDNGIDNLFNFNKIKDVYQASLAVEKSLYERLCEY